MDEGGRSGASLPWPDLPELVAYWMALKLPGYKVLFLLHIWQETLASAQRQRPLRQETFAEVGTGFDRRRTVDILAELEADRLIFRESHWTAGGREPDEIGLRFPGPSPPEERTMPESPADDRAQSTTTPRPRRRRKGENTGTGISPRSHSSTNEAQRQFIAHWQPEETPSAGVAAPAPTHEEQEDQP